MVTVKHSAYERCVNMLNDLTAAQDKLICAALEELQKQRDEARAALARAGDEAALTDKGNSLTIPEEGGLGVLIQRRLDDLGWTKSDLARRLKVTPARITNLLTQGNMTEGTALKVFTVLGLRLEAVETSRPSPPTFERKHGGMTV